MYKNILKYELTKEDIKYQEIANYLKIDKSNFGNYIKEIKIMPLKYLTKICDYLKITLDYVFELSSENNFKQKIGTLNKKTIGSKLSQFRKERNISQNQLARIINDNRTNISGYENGNCLIPTPFLYKLCQKYKISTDYFLK